MLSAQLSMEFKLLIEINYWKIKIFHPPKLSDVVFVMLINVKFQQLLAFMINFMRSQVEHHKHFITSGPGLILETSWFVLENIVDWEVTNK